MYSGTKFTISRPNTFEKLKSKVLYHDCFQNKKYLEPLSPQQNEALNRLDKDGYVVFDSYIAEEKLKIMQTELNQALIDLQFNMPCLAQKKIDPIRHKELIDNYLFGSTQQLQDWEVTFERSQAKNYQQVLEEFGPSTLTVPMLKLSKTYRDTWTDPFILGIVANYLGMVPKLVEAYVRRNFPAQHRSMNHYWHRDINNDFHLLKMFVFLSDCTIETGPHEFIKGSHSNLNILNGQRYYQDEQVDSLYPQGHENRILSTVKAGTIVLENTQGLHRANIPNTAYRDLGYGVFMPTPPLYRHKNYHFPKESYDLLSDFQQAFIPKSFTY